MRTSGGLNQREGASIGATRAPGLPPPRFLPRAPKNKTRFEHQEQVVRSTPPSYARRQCCQNGEGPLRDSLIAAGARGANRGSQICRSRSRRKTHTTDRRRRCRHPDVRFQRKHMLHNPSVRNGAPLATISKIHKIHTSAATPYQLHLITRESFTIAL